MDSAYTTQLGDLLGSRVVAMTALGGGDVAQAFRAELDSGQIVFAKTKPDASLDFFATEAAGLEWLREPHIVAVPEVLAVGTDPPWLVLEWIETGHGGPDEAAFGENLAALHLSGAECFGRTDRQKTGSRGLPNEPCVSWADFLRTNRLEPLMRLAVDSDSLHHQVIADIESVAGRLESLLGLTELPARLHGDLWAGNRMVGADGTSWLIDPACFGGHREFDLAMMRLFGGFGEDVFAAYDDYYPLSPAWRDRIDLHQLVPLMVHAIKFGGSYHSATAAVAARYS
ncbi:MAG: fructosamine kinase family protein [Actinomycetia bacterium]|nr:fructosamine kinase family protein [Actinomycetes bacterium]MCP4957717.1 fructosamine kinase family protein [Actinomycetes bacterium]